MVITNGHKHLQLGVVITTIIGQALYWRLSRLVQHTSHLTVTVLLEPNVRQASLLAAISECLPAESLPNFVFCDTRLVALLCAVLSRLPAALKLFSYLLRSTAVFGTMLCE